MRHPTAGDAKDRRVVRLPNGRLGRVVFVPPAGRVEGKRVRNHSHGSKCRVVLGSGRYVSVARESLVVVEQVEATP